MGIQVRRSWVFRLAPVGLVVAATLAPAQPDKPAAKEKPLSLAANKSVWRFPAPLGDLCVGGDGRYLVLHFPSERRLAVFDVTQAKVVKSIPVAHERAVFAAGMEELVVVLAEGNVLQRWDLATGERKSATPLGLKGTPRTACMGAASDGPLLVGPLHGENSFEGAVFVDVQTAKPLRFTGSVNRPRTRLGMGENTYARAAADGRLFTLWNFPGASNSIVHLLGPELRVHSTGGVGPVVPSADGQSIIVHNAQLFAPDFRKPPDSVFMPDHPLVPALQGPYYAGLHVLKERTDLSVYFQGEPQPFATFTDLEYHDAGREPPRRERGGSFDREIFFLPRLNLLLTIPTANDRLVFHRLDVDAALRRSGRSYLFVESQPPPRARKGATYTYQLAAKSKAAGVSYNLEHGPPGMALSPSGQLRWPVPADFREAEATVIVHVQDAQGLGHYHAFMVNVRD